MDAPILTQSAFRCPNLAQVRDRQPLRRAQEARETTGDAPQPVSPQSRALVKPGGAVNRVAPDRLSG